MASVLVYDGDCGMCTKTAAFAANRLRPSPGRYAVTAYQDADLVALGLTPRQCAHAVRWVSAGGRTYAAEDAVARALLASRWWVRPAGLAILAPGLHTVAGHLYRWVARNRHRLPGGTPACALPVADRPR
jgi:predicted DCC family thiol-disulfide oxidoreductase YuxK